MTSEPVENSHWGLPDQETMRQFLGPRIWHAVGHHAQSALVEPAREMVARPSKHFRAKLVRLGYDLVRPAGDSDTDHKWMHAASAIELVHAGSLIVDDIQDQSPMRRGQASLHRLYGLPGALCAGNWLYFRPLRLLADIGLPPALENQAFKVYHEALELAHYGQALDLNIKVDQLEAAEIPAICDAVSELKTGAITALAMNLGALVGGASPSLALRIGEFGRQFGTALQQCDDVGSVTSPHADPAKKYEDLIQRKPTAVWSLAVRLVPESFPELQQAVTTVAQDPTPLELWLTRTDFASRAFHFVEQKLSQAFDGLREEAEINSNALSQLKIMGDQLIDAYR